MKIVRILQHRFRKDYQSVLTEEGKSIKLHTELAQKHHLVDGMELPESQWEDILQLNHKKEALDYCYLLLSYRSRSEKEMMQKLERKKYTRQIIHSVIKELKENRLIDDSTFAKNLAESKLKHKNWGRAKIERDLIAHGVSPESAKILLCELAEEENKEFVSEDERAYQALLKRKSQLSSVEPHTRYRRLFEYLLRRGFTYDTVEKALSRFRRENLLDLDDKETEEDLR